MIPVEIFEPKPGTSLAKKTFDSTTPAVFYKLFALKHSFGASSTMTVPDLVTLALDAGYGAPSDQRGFLGMSAANTRRLAQYQRARFGLIEHLLSFNGPGIPLGRHPVAAYLESSDKSDASYILGGLTCRYATGQWLGAKGATLKRFWHFTIYSDPAVSGIHFSFRALKVNTSRKSKKGADRRPDYLVEADNGRWYAVEAKGSFDDGVDKAAIKSGMDQARRLRSITLMIPPATAPVSHTISDYACSAAYFAAGTRLNVEFFDPPADPDGDEPEDEFLSLEIEPEVADLLGFYRAIQQFRALSDPGRPELPPALRALDGVRWGTIIRPPRASGMRDGGIWLGLPDIVAKEEARMRKALRLMVVLAPVLREVYDGYAASRSNLVLRERLSLALQHAGAMDELQPMHRQMLGRLNKHLLAGEAAPPTWCQAMRICCSAPIFGPGQHPRSIDDLVDQLRVQLRLTDYASLNLELHPQNARGRLAVSTTAYGLVVAAGFPWEPRPQERASSRSKV